jgi:hypothetical protein
MKLCSPRVFAETVYCLKKSRCKRPRGDESSQNIIDPIFLLRTNFAFFCDGAFIVKSCQQFFRGTVLIRRNHFIVPKIIDSRTISEVVCKIFVIDALEKFS